MGFDQPVHWVVILIVAGLLFGGYKRLPEMSRSAARSMRIFKTELKGMEGDDQARAANDAAQQNGYPQQNGFNQQAPQQNGYAGPDASAPQTGFGAQPAGQPWPAFPQTQQPQFPTPDAPALPSGPVPSAPTQNAPDSSAQPNS